MHKSVILVKLISLTEEPKLSRSIAIHDPSFSKFGSWAQLRIVVRCNGQLLISMTLKIDVFDFDD